MLKIKLNKQQCKSYKEALLLRNFNLGYIGIKILCDRKCSDENKKEYFTRILNGKGECEKQIRIMAGVWHR